jgi:DNA polymerase-3 subunit gamma/tau
MSYLVSARKYRPQRFEELIGQQHIAHTLKNAIVKNRVGHAYLFSGPRGIGKTSAARIFAKALNCEKGPTPTPCNQCSFCVEITEGMSLDLVEIDGASNRRVDEIRQLRENVRFVPSSAKYKIYIIDEVHMLTTEAFNALLKTLEEPPPHIVFIFATTEVNKVPQTIRSRCQQFNFKRISIPEMLPVLKRILDDVGMKAEETALFWIAKSAYGSLRDAESILDQMISYCDETVGEKDVFYVLGIPSYDVYHEFAKNVSKGDFKSCILHLDSLISEGFEIHTLIAGMIEYFRNMYVLSVDSSAEEIIDLPEEEIETMKGHLGHFTTRDISNILVLLSRAYGDVRGSSIMRELFEITLIKLVHYKEVIQPSLLLKQLKELRYRIDGRTGELFAGEEIAGKEEGNTATNPTHEVEAAPQKSEVLGMNPDLMERIISYFSKKRRAIAEFLGRAKDYRFENNLFTFTYAQDEKLSYEHVSEESTRRYIESEMKAMLGSDLRIQFLIESKSQKSEEDLRSSPQVSKVLEIFKGEIVSEEIDPG